MKKAPEFATDSKVGHKTPDHVPDTNIGNINISKAKEVKDFLSSPLPVHRHSPNPEACLTPIAEAEVALMKDNTLRYLNELEERCTSLEYTLLGVMHSVDKWLVVEPYDFDKDDGTVAATRASNAKEVALKAIEKLESRLAQVERERDAAVRDLEEVTTRVSSWHIDCDYCKDKEKPICESCNWQWRGICAENTHEVK